MENPYAKKTEEAIEKGGLLAQLYFDLHARSKESLENLGVGFSSTLGKEEGVIFAITEVEKPIENEDKSYSTYIRATLLFSDFPALCKMLTKYNPVSIEIIKPEQLKLKNIDLMEGLMAFSETLYNLKFKLYKDNLSEKEKAFIESIIKAREEMGKKLRKGQ
ncbi:MAG: hypothetical protein QXS91_03510 [Candidatus Anstonellales archaeon]